MKEKGFIHIYTGNGKGKTTAALGLAFRAAGAGLRSFILQFMKEYPYSELNSLAKFKDEIIVKQVCNDDWVFKKEPPPEEEKIKAARALDELESSMRNSEFDIYILDEICVAIYFKLIDESRAAEILKAKPDNVELVFTGRYCPEKLIESADLVTEMKEIKHYFTQGVLSRKGIDS